MGPKEIVDVVYDKCFPYDPIEAVLQQEVRELESVSTCFIEAVLQQEVRELESVSTCFIEAVLQQEVREL